MTKSSYVEYLPASLSKGRGSFNYPELKEKVTVAQF